MSNFKEFSDKYSIRIPLIQRDYVQGLDANDAKRDKFVRCLLSSLCDNRKLSLDFIYGSIYKKALKRNNEVFEPLDGQQRLTTLSLLCLMLSKRATDAPAIPDNLRKFSYTTRTSSTKFCEKLFSEEEPFPAKDITKFIEDRSWYSIEWDNDPTIRAMKEMMELINSLLNEKTSEEINRIADNLYGANSSIIEFDELNMGDYHLSDALYIKMNARGKQLTDFENWKASFIKFLASKYANTSIDSKNIPEDIANSINKTDVSYKEYFEYSIEHQWTELLWDNAFNAWDSNEKAYPVIDSHFMNLFTYISQVLYFINTDSIVENGKKRDVIAKDFETDNSKPGFQKQQEEIYSKEENILFLFQALDLFNSIQNCEPEQDNNIAKFFGKLFYVESENPGSVGNTAIFGTSDTNLFQICVHGEWDVKLRLLLYCIIKYCIKHQCHTATNELKKYVRCCRNMLESIIQRDTRDVAIRSNIRLADFKKYDRAISALIEKSDITVSLNDISEEEATNFGMGISKEREKVLNGFYNDDDTGRCIARIENMEMLRGNLQMLPMDLLKKNSQTVLSALTDFMQLEQPKKSQLLVAFGFRGINLGESRLGTKTFFGNDGRWDVLFFSGNGSFQNAITQYLLQYAKESKIILDNSSARKQQDFDFAYYALKYDTFLSARLWNEEPNFYFGVNEDIDDLDIEAFIKYGARPVSGYHTEPFAACVADEIKKKKEDESIFNDLEFAGYYSTKASLHLKSPKLRIKLIDKNWHVFFDDDSNLSTEDIQEKLSSDDTTLRKDENQDLIQAAINFVKWVYSKPELFKSELRRFSKAAMLSSAT